MHDAPWSRALRFVAAIAGVAGCNGAQVRTQQCPAVAPQQSASCDAPPSLVCGSDTYRCTCEPRPGRQNERAWLCVSAGGPLAPPELMA